MPHSSKLNLAYGETVSLKCKGEGKGRCKVFAKITSGHMQDWQNIDKGKYAYVVKREYELKIYEKTEKTKCNSGN